MGWCFQWEFIDGYLNTQCKIHKGKLTGKHLSCMDVCLDARTPLIIYFCEQFNLKKQSLPFLPVLSLPLDHQDQPNYPSCVRNLSAYS